MTLDIKVLQLILSWLENEHNQVLLMIYGNVRLRAFNGFNFAQNLVMTDKQTEARIERRKPKPDVGFMNYGWVLFLLAVGLLLMAGYFVATQKLYKPGSTLGYNMGLVGGVMMLTLLLYPLRKRVGFMKGLGLLPKWFKWHMVFGILGPSLILFHSTFYIGSINAGVALVCMLLVAGSGVFGRFFYTKIHHGLYGRELTLKELHAEVEKAGGLKTVFSFAPEIEKTLAQFHAHAVRTSVQKQLGLWNFITIGIHAAHLSRSLSKDLHRIMYVQAQEKKWNVAQMRRLDELYAECEKTIHTYVKTVRDVSQFHTYERLFSWWHIFHIPLVYMLIFSGIYHVIAVHMF